MEEYQIVSKTKQGFIIKVPKLNIYFIKIVSDNNVVDIRISDDINSARIFDNITEAREWLEKINSNEMAYKKILNEEKINESIWEIILVDVCNDEKGFLSLKEITTW